MTIDPELLSAINAVGEQKMIPPEAISIMRSWLSGLAQGDISKDESFSRLELLLEKLAAVPAERT